MSVRTRNKARRRADILRIARHTLAREGFEALKLRELAAAAGVTVPTVYNLIGGKTELLMAIVTEMVDQLMWVQNQPLGMPIDQLFVGQINRMTQLFASDEDGFRAAFLAGDRLGLFERASKAGFYRQAVEVPIQACQVAQSSGVLLGHVSAEALGHQLYGSYRLARQDWSSGYIELPEFRTQALTGMCLCLAADADGPLRSELLTRIAEADFD